MLKFGGWVLVVAVFLASIMPFALGLYIPPTDLGIRYTDEDLVSAEEELGEQVVGITSDINMVDFTLEGSKEVNFFWDSKKLTAWLNNRKWKLFPLKQIQVAIDKDGIVEGSGILQTSKILPFAYALGYSPEEILTVMEKYQIPAWQIPIYIKGSGQVVDNKVIVDVKTIRLGRIYIPIGIISQINKEAETALEDLIIRQSQSFSAEILNFAEGRFNFKGTIPEKEYVLME